MHAEALVARGRAPHRARFSDPSPPRTFAHAGLGWSFGLGCGTGLFFGMGVSSGPLGVLFGAGAGAGSFCGVGFGAGAVAVLGSSGYVPVGVSSAVFYTPRLDWAEGLVEPYVSGLRAAVGRAARRLAAFAAARRRRDAKDGRVGVPERPRQPQQAGPPAAPPQVPQVPQAPQAPQVPHVPQPQPMPDGDSVTGPVAALEVRLRQRARWP